MDSFIAREGHAEAVGFNKDRERHRRGILINGCRIDSLIGGRKRVPEFEGSGGASFLDGIGAGAVDAYGVSGGPADLHSGDSGLCQ